MTLEQDVARRVELKETIDRLNQEVALIDDRLRQHDYGNYDAGDWTLQLQHSRTLNGGRFAEAYPVTKFPELYKAVPDTAAIKEHIAPVALDAFYDEGRPKVVVK